MKVTLRRKQLPFIIAGLAQVKGMKDFRKAISLGRDSRALKACQDDSEAALKACKPENFDSLLDELRELKAAKAKEFVPKEGEVINENAITAHVLTHWTKTKEWVKANKDYNDATEAIANEIIDIEVHTELSESDFPKCAEDVDIAEVLSYFMKENKK